MEFFNVGEDLRLLPLNSRRSVPMITSNGLISRKNIVIFITTSLT